MLVYFLSNLYLHPSSVRLKVTHQHWLDPLTISFVTPQFGLSNSEETFKAQNRLLE